MLTFCSSGCSPVQNTYTNADKLLEAAEQLAQTGECDPEEIYQAAHQLEDRIQDFVRRVEQRKILLDMSVSFHTHVKEVMHHRMAKYNLADGVFESGRRNPVFVIMRDIGCSMAGRCEYRMHWGRQEAGWTSAGCVWECISAFVGIIRKGVGVEQTPVGQGCAGKMKQNEIPLERNSAPSM